MKYEYFVSYHAVNKHVGNLYGSTTIDTGEPINSAERVKDLSDHVQKILLDELDAKFSVVIINFQLLREESK